MESGDVSRWCRICSSEFIVGIFIFGEEARRLFLQAKITKYLAFSVSVDDKLPKMICEECFKKIDSFHKFAQMALRNQDKLNKFVANNPNNGSGASEPMKVDDKSLLHTYLTKGFKEKDATPNPPPQVQQKESEVTEMEVRIDPMMILQCSTQNTDDDDCENDYGSGEESDTSDSNNEENYSSDLTCPFCPGTFNTEYDLQIHKLDHSDPNEDDKRENDEDEGKFACPICGKFISTKGNLKVHLETHRPKGKYECDICGRVFKTQCNLHRHKEYHGGIQYPCGVCGRVYPTNSTLRAHSITHSDLRPHKCPLCDKTFKRNQDLKFHINQHTGARPYQCPYCPKAFASSGNCFSHRKRMHPMEVERDREKAAKIMR